MKETIDWLTTFQTKDGNLPSSIESGHSHLVQFCHGAPGLVLLLTEAVKTFADREKPWLEKATSAGLCIWQKGLLVKGVGEFDALESVLYVRIVPWYCGQRLRVRCFVCRNR